MEMRVLLAGESQQEGRQSEIPIDNAQERRDCDRFVQSQSLLSQSREQR
jgi:hypothetical protein